MNRFSSAIVRFGDFTRACTQRVRLGGREIRAADEVVRQAGPYASLFALLVGIVITVPSLAAPKAPTTRPAAPKPKSIDKLPNGAPKDEVLKYYGIEDIPTPPGVAGEVGGMTFMPDGRLAVCFHAGDVWTYTPENRKWEKFAEGLHEPLGMVAINDDEVVVMQRPELTRITDANADGVADTYTTLTDQFGMTGNYHEFAFGPAVDKDGNFYVALNCASNGAGVRHEIRGEYRADGRDGRVGSSRVDLQACKLEYSIVSPK